MVLQLSTIIELSFNPYCRATENMSSPPELDSLSDQARGIQFSFAGWNDCFLHLRLYAWRETTTTLPWAARYVQRQRHLTAVPLLAFPYQYENCTHECSHFGDITVPFLYHNRHHPGLELVDDQRRATWNGDWKIKASADWTAVNLWFNLSIPYPARAPVHATFFSAKLMQSSSPECPLYALTKGIAALIYRDTCCLDIARRLRASTLFPTFG